MLAGTEETSQLVLAVILVMLLQTLFLSPSTCLLQVPETELLPGNDISVLVTCRFNFKQGALLA